MRRFAFVSLAVLAMAMLPTIVHASVVGHLVKGTVNQLEDDDFEALINAGGTIADPPGGAVGDDDIDEGDFLVGMFKITAFYAPPFALPPTFDPADSPPAATITGIFAAKVDTVTPLGGGQASFVFTAPTLAEWTALGMPILPSSDDVAIIFFDDPDNIDHTIDDLPTALATVNGTMLWEFGGFSADSDVNWEATGPTDVNPLPVFGTAGTFNAALNVVNYGAGPPLVPIVNGFFPGDTDLFFTGSIAAPGSAVGDDFDAQSDSDAFLLPVPEPASMTIWGGLALAGAVAGYRRRKLAKNA